LYTQIYFTADLTVHTYILREVFVFIRHLN